MSKKLGVIVPYRDRYKHLIRFKDEFKKYMSTNEIDYELIIVEQDDAKSFNRGMLLNIGFIYAKKLKCDYVVFHDIDMLPVDVNYGYSDIPLHLANNFINEGKNKRIVFDEYFGGVTLFPMDQFEMINGYSNEYWGWGFEDDDLLFRCIDKKINLNTKEIIMKNGNTAALKFNGQNAYVKCKNIVNIFSPFTIFISFYPDDLVLDHEKREDLFSIFSIPGYDFSLSYTSYKRYSLKIFDSEFNIIQIDSDISPNYKTNLCVTIDPNTNEISLYQDGFLIETKLFEKKLYNYNREEYIYLGTGNSDRGYDQNFYRGLINSFAVYDGILDKKEIKEISDNKFFGLTQSFGKYNSAYKLSLYYDAKFIKNYKLMDLSGNRNDGEINNCEIVGYTFEDIKTISIPYRRTCTFRILDHEENGYFNGGWKNQTTRYNQLRFENEVTKKHKQTNNDGLSNCNFTEYSETKVDNITHVVVGI